MKSFSLKNWIFVLAISGGFPIVASADISATQIPIEQDQYITSTLAPDQYDKLSTDQQKTLASAWGLSVTDYSHYLSLMKNTANGFYYENAHLDPSWILGFNASNDEERKKFASIAIQNERARVAKELAFQREFQQLQLELYPNEKPIASPIAQQKSQNNVSQSLQLGDSFLLFTDINNTSINHNLGHLISKVVSHPGVKLNLYFVGNAIDSDIRHWAAQQAIPENLVKTSVITLNHDDGRFTKLSQGKNQLPLLILNRNGQFEVIQWNSI